MSWGQSSVTQPALTKQIQMLENLSGVTLFQRGRHGAKLTIAGEQLLHEAYEAVNYYEKFLRKAGDIQKGNTCKIMLGFGISSFRLAPEKVAIFRSLFADIQVFLNDMPSMVQCRELLEGNLQAGFVRLPVFDELQSKVLAEEKLVLAVASNCLTGLGETALKLIEKNLLLQLSPNRGEGLSTQTSRFLMSHNLFSKKVAAADDIQTLLALVAAGYGVALLPESVRYILSSGVNLIALEGEYTTWQTGIAWNSRIKDPLRDNFLNIVIA
ncbi:LysR family transcriptional regulator [Enterobacter ludwigii]|uniref:LysR family transcriptional regulator n=1 Tax=Enterobacter ludwigii TaxID=299767 RepID=UPI0024189940|nr:LysR family transcriptional regulator [Enterobacter ludwigii]